MAVTSAGGLFSGEVFFGNGANSKNFISVGETDKFEISTPTDKKTLTTKKPIIYGQTNSTVYVPAESTCAITLKTFNKLNIEMALRGISQNIEVTTGSVSNILYTGTKHDTVFFLNHHTVSNVVVNSSDDVTTYAIETDYIIDEKNGIVKVLSGGNIGDGDTLSLSYDHPNINGFTVDAAKKSGIEVPIMIIGNNLATGDKIRGFLPSVVLTPSSGIDFLSDDFVSIELEGVPQTGPNGESPFSLTILN